ncbi:MAG: Rab family GTPase [Candidatus Hodarchaeota archaeon]
MSFKCGTKAVILGDGGTGKTTLVERASKITSSKNGRMTILFELHQLKIQKQTIVVLDIGGQKQFQKAIQLIDGLFKGIQFVILCFDVSRYASFKNLSMWLNFVKMRLPNAPIILVGTKADKVPSVGTSEIEEFLKTNNISQYVVTSALEGYNIQVPFEWVVAQ